LQDGLLKLRHKDFAGARGSLEEALRSAPDDTRILETLAGSYVVQNQGPRSIQLVRDYASARPKSPRAQYFLGTWLLRMRDLQGARTAFELVKSLDPAFSEADIALARLDAGEGKTGPACERLAKLLAGNGRNLPALLLLGEIEYAAGNAAAAAEHLRKAVDMEPRNPKALNDLAYVLADGAGRPDEALKFAQQAYEDQPGSALVRDTIGWVYYKKGFYDAAVRYLESAVSAQGAAIYRYHLAMAYHKAGKFDSARETYRRALAADAKLPEAKAAKELIETKAATNLDR
jgi:tetratricopeptide (TPR) repeat protein